MADTEGGLGVPDAAFYTDGLDAISNGGAVPCAILDVQPRHKTHF